MHPTRRSAKPTAASPIRPSWPSAGWAVVLAMLFAVVLTGGAAAQSPLADAIEQRDATRIGQLLESGEDVNASQPDGMTPLHWAVYLDQPQLVNQLLKTGARVEPETRYGVRPLSLACLNGHAEIVSTLLAAGADPQTKLPGGETALMTAARTGRLKPVELLLRRGAQVDAEEMHGQTALIWAAAEGHAPVVRELIVSGADFRRPLKSGLTPLHLAARDGHIGVVKVLLELGVDVSETVRPERRPDKGPQAGLSALLLAVENGHFELALYLVDQGADPNDQRGGFTPLHTLSWVRKPNRGDGPDGDPPPRGSGKIDSLDFVRGLVQRGADVNATLPAGGGIYGIKREGATPFLLASSTADLPLMKLLVELGADPRRANADGTTPLMVAAGVGTGAPTEEAGTEAEVLQTLEFLRQQGAELDTVDRRGDTAMHGAAYKNLPQVAIWLAEQGASIDVWLTKNRQGWDPVQIAEGFRPGNFKPSPETVAALHQVLRAAGRTPPPPTNRKVLEDRDGYQ